MPYPFAEIAFTDAVKQAQTENGSRQAYAQAEAQAQRAGDRFGPAERTFLQARDSFYMATVNSEGWPYVQHRGGPAGFVRVLDDTTLGFADYTGNRQYVSLGNMADERRVSLFFMDYANRRRLKLFARATVLPPEDPRLAVLTAPGAAGPVERGMVLDLVAFDWNCPKYITERFTLADVEAAQAGLLQRIADLEVQLAEAQGS